MQTDDIMTKIEEFEKQRKELETTIKECLETTLMDFIKDNPIFYSILWEQWIPGFNDGDPCTFTMGEVKYTLNEDDDPYDGEMLVLNYKDAQEKVAIYNSWVNRTDDEEWKEANKQHMSNSRGSNNPCWWFEYIDSYIEELNDHKKQIEKYGEDYIKKSIDNFNYLSKFIYSIHDYLESIYDVNVRIIVTKNGIDVDEYCGY